MFVVGGWDAIKNPAEKAKKAEPVALPIAERVAFLPQDAEKLVQFNGAVMLAAGSLLAIGKFRRLAALTLIGSILPTTYAGHRFWEEEEEATKAQQRVHFLKNLGLLGGLILEAVDTEGAPSLGWRATHRKSRKRSDGGHELGKRLGEGITAAEGVLSAAAKAGGPVIEQAKESAGRIPHQSRRALRRAQKQAAKIDIAQQLSALKSARDALAKTAKASRGRMTKAEKATRKLELNQQKAALKEAQKSLRKAVKHARTNVQPLLSQGRSQVAPLVSSAASTAGEAFSHLRSAAER
jgi:uncharacterized membrane protein YphA (DoxX/SURF4 family)/cell fate (sporulation/competence/biofilm development) regulator YlbF (YheA/YmcA/DUF963 family)